MTHVHVSAGFIKGELSEGRLNRRPDANLERTLSSHKHPQRASRRQLLDMLVVPGSRNELGLRVSPRSGQP